MIGQVELSLGTLVGSKDFTYKSDLFMPGKKDKRGEIIVKIAKIQESTMEVTLKLGAKNLPIPTSCFCAGNISPFIGIDKTYQAGGKLNFVPLQKTEVSTSNTANPSFQALKFKGQ